MIRTEVTSPDLVDLAVAIRYEENGAVLRRELLRNLRAAVRPAVAEAKSSIMSMPSGGLRQGGGSLRRAIVRQITTEVSLTQRRARVKVKVRKRGMPRDFVNAPKTVSLPGGWRHPVFPQKGGAGAAKWVSQIGKPGWFDEPLRSHRGTYRAAVKAAMDATAERIARKV